MCTSPVLTAPVFPKQIFTTVAIHVASFIDLLKTHIVGRATICKGHTDIHAHGGLFHPLMESRWHPSLVCVGLL